MTAWDDATIDWYAATHGEDATTRTVVDATPLAPGETVLDIGCGTGASLRRALKNGALRGVGVDLERMVRHARAANPGPGLEFIAATAEALPFADRTFDGVLAVNAVHHWPDSTAGLAEAARVLKRGGWLAIGGERFGTNMVPDGQDYAETLATLGFRRIETRAIDGGFVTTAWCPRV